MKIIHLIMRNKDLHSKHNNNMKDKLVLQHVVQQEVMKILIQDKKVI